MRVRLILNDGKKVEGELISVSEAENSTNQLLRTIGKAMRENNIKGYLIRTDKTILYIPERRVKKVEEVS